MKKELNIFQRIGNRIEKKKEEEELMVKRYWKLSPIERMEYDQKRDRIIEQTNIHFLGITKFFILGVLGFSFLVFLISFGSGHTLNYIVNLFKPIAKIFPLFIVITLVLDYFFIIINILFGERKKRIENLNKRFKLK